MSTDESLDIDQPDAPFEALLRSRLHELADHAPATVHAVDELSVRRTERGRRNWRSAGIAASVVALVGAGSLAFVVSGRNDVAGADSPDAAVSEMVAAIENSDVLGVIDLLDPAEVPALRAALDRGRSTAEQIGAIRSDLSLDKLQGLDIDVADLSLSTEELAPDLAVVTPVSGSITATLDPAAVPLGPDVAAAMDPGAEPMTATGEFGDSLDGVRIATVERDGRWFVSLQYSVAESARQAADKPFPTEPAVVPVGAATPTDAATRFYTALVQRDAAGLATSFAPGEGDALLRYAPLWVPALQQGFDESRLPGDTGAVSGIEVQVDGSGSRVMAEPVAYTVEGTVDPTHQQSGMPPFDPSIPTLIAVTGADVTTPTWVWMPAGVAIPDTIDGLDGYERLTGFPDDLMSAGGGAYNYTWANSDGTINPLPTADAELGEPVPFRIDVRDGCTTYTGAGYADLVALRSQAGVEKTGDDAWRQCSPMYRNAGLLSWWVGLEFAFGVTMLPPLGLVEVDGAWYVSPVGTAAEELLSLVRPYREGGGLFDSALGSAVYGIDRPTLESTMSGLTLDQVPGECRVVLATDASGVITGVVDIPDASALRACGAAFFAGWSPYSTTDSDGSVSTDATVDTPTVSTAIATTEPLAP